MKVVLLSYPKLCLIYSAIAVMKCPQTGLTNISILKLASCTITTMKGYDDTAPRFDGYAPSREVLTPGK
jgi:hypothetical protein